MLCFDSGLIDDRKWQERMLGLFYRTYSHMCTINVLKKLYGNMCEEILAMTWTIVTVATEPFSCLLWINLVLSFTKFIAVRLIEKPTNDFSFPFLSSRAHSN
jgi:hypothetical protein